MVAAFEFWKRHGIDSFDIVKQLGLLLNPPPQIGFLKFSPESRKIPEPRLMNFPNTLWGTF